MARCQDIGHGEVPASRCFFVDFLSGKMHPDTIISKRLMMAAVLLRTTQQIMDIRKNVVCEIIIKFSPATSLSWAFFYDYPNYGKRDVFF